MTYIVWQDRPDGGWSRENCETLEEVYAYITSDQCTTHNPVITKVVELELREKVTLAPLPVPGIGIGIPPNWPPGIPYNAPAPYTVTAGAGVQV